MGVPFKDAPVHESSRVTLVCVADEVLGLGDGVGAEFPLQASGKTSPSPAPEAGLLNLFPDLLRGHVLQGGLRSLVSVGVQVVLYAIRIDETAPSQDEPVLLGKKIQLVVGGDPGIGLVAVLHDLTDGIIGDRGSLDNVILDYLGDHLRLHLGVGDTGMTRE